MLTLKFISAILNCNKILGFRRGYKNEKTYKTHTLLLTLMLVFSGCSFGANDKTTTTTTEEDVNLFGDEESMFDNEWIGEESDDTTTQPQPTNNSKDEPTTNKKETTTQDEVKNEWTTAKIVDYFNKSANKVKTDAVTVTKNYEYRTVGEIEVPDILQSTVNNLLTTAMKDDTDPIVYGTKEEIQENFQVPNQSYVSRLTVDSVESAEIKDKGNEYAIRIELYNEKNPIAGSGVGSVFDVIEAAEVAESGMVEDFSTEYYDCVVIATIDKATGRMTHANYTTPLILNVTVNLLGRHNGKLGVTFEKDYTITY